MSFYGSADIQFLAEKSDEMQKWVDIDVRISMAPTLNDIVRMYINDKVTSLAYLMSQRNGDI